MTDLDPRLADRTEIDPDPFTIACAYLAGAAIVLQCVQIWQTHHYGKAHAPAPSRALSRSETDRINGLEAELEAMRRHLRALTRAIERGSANADQQYYDSKFRVGEQVMLIDVSFHQQVTNDLGHAYARTGNMSIWLNSIIGQDPALASRIGKALDAKVPGAAKQLNKLIADGAPNRTVIVEATRVLDALEEVIKNLHEGN